MSRANRALSLLFAAVLPLGACDNVGRAFDPVLDPGGGGPSTGGTSDIQVVPVGGDARDGRPLVRQAYPKGAGWPTTVPIVVEFSESMNESTLVPTTPGGTDGRLLVRVRGTQQALPAVYDVLGNGRLFVLRPTPALANVQNPSYEVVLLPGARDADGVRFRGDAEEILAEFTVDAPAEAADAEILAMFPRDNARDVARSTDVTVVFTRPANATSVTATSFRLQTAGGTAVVGDIEMPLVTIGASTTPEKDTRVVRFHPTAPALLAPSTEHQLVVTQDITFGTAGRLQFNGRTPFARFTTVGVPPPTDVEVANPSAGFPDKINRANVANLMLAVTVPAEAQAGDRVLARLYGGDRSTTNNDVDLLFFERSTVLAVAGMQTVTLDFGGALGTLERPKLDDDEVRMVAQLQRGSAHSGFVYGDTEARFDVTMPDIVRIGPPGAATGTTAYTDQEAIALYGTATEQLADATLVVDAVSVSLFGSSSGGRFVMPPVALGRLAAPRAYSLTLTDLAGNLSAAPVTGNIVQRGVIDGTVAGTLTVEAYDESTLLPVAGAIVVVDPGVPTVPPAGRLTMPTGADGRAMFSGLAAATHTITILHDSYHLTTLYDSAAAYASLPCAPRAAATATFRGTVANVPPTPVTTTVLVGNSAFADPTLLGVVSAQGSPATIPPTPIRANRPQVVTALGGGFEPSGIPAIATSGSTMLGITLTDPAPPAAPAAPGGDSSVAVGLVPTVTPAAAGLATMGSEDFALATGLDTANLVGGRPIVRCALSLAGFSGQVPFGAGVTMGAGPAVTIDATWSVPLYVGLFPFVTAQWLVTEARDTNGNTSRHRSYLLLPNSTLLDTLNPLPIPVVTAPASSVGPPSVDVADVLDPAALPGFAMLDLLVQDPNGRQWTVLVEDDDARGGVQTVQLPPLTGAGATGLVAGAWTLRATARVFLSFSSLPHQFVLAERIRQEAGMARGAAVTVTVQ